MTTQFNNYSSFLSYMDPAVIMGLDLQAQEPVGKDTTTTQPTGDVVATADGSNPGSQTGEPPVP